jgi:hypothetical protein
MPQAGKRRDSGRLSRWSGRALAGLAAAIGLATALTFAAAPSRAEAGLAIELNKVEDLGGGCVASLIFQNNLGATLDRFSLDLFLFDRKGVILRRVTIDMAPLQNGKTRVAQFHLYPGPCAEVSRILVNDFPQCRAENGASVDCLAGLTVSSRSTIELAK